MNTLSFFQVLIMGVVEGVTEFIPVSSTGHLIIISNLLNFTGKKENAFVIFIQLGAVFAVVWLYRKKFLAVVSGWRQCPESRRLLSNLFVGTLPSVLFGLPTEGWVEAHLFKPIPVSLALICGGIGILIIERLYKFPSIDSVDDITIQKALGVGFIQVLSILFPGVSRSGATIMGGLALGLSRRAATEFSFFLAIPAMVGASVVKLAGSSKLITLADLLSFSSGFGISFISAMFVIRGLLAYVSNNSFAAFAWYRIMFGVFFLCMHFFWAEVF